MDRIVYSFNRPKLLSGEGSAIPISRTIHLREALWRKVSQDHQKMP